ncbi:CD9 antigen isoform X1 [Neodiprion pinetum]|uniref:Tetraspanin n=2 Tax=Neodiprion TaxID=270857 RepID=A0A6J0B9D0_NEOLC|nr:CD9 antigen [Neodiprion lecontei]XP_046421499.1 CD9 antigen-like [Neodiprion fabricii]XP_046479390.1 CD9 antigen-like [Neodiprion pinetum]XP_046614898.1 CD9 antigen-like [Neodiprion virginianus]
MGLSGCYGVIKYLLVFVNLIFWAVASATVILAIWMLTDPTFIVSLAQEEHNYHAGLYILLAAGVLMLIVAILGCCGAFRESQCMLVGFFSCLLVVIVAQIAAGAWLYTNSERLKQLVEASVANTVKSEYGVISSRTATIDAIQSDLSCCGVTGPSNWAGSQYVQKDRAGGIKIGVTADNSYYRVPLSCCKDKGSPNCQDALKPGDEIGSVIYEEGCLNKLVDALVRHMSIVLGVTIGAGILELLGLIFALVLCCAIGSSDRYKA